MRLRALLVALALAAVPGLPARADGGAVWLPTLQATQGFDHLSAFPDGTFYAQYLDTYARSTDAGKTWTVMPRPPRQYVGSPGIRFATPKVGWSVAGGVGVEDLLTADVTDEVKRCGDLMPLHRTTDGGTTWRAVCVPNSTTLSNPYFAVGGSGLAVGRDGRTAVLVGSEMRTDKPAPDCGTYGDVVYTTHDGGSKWIRAALPRGWTSGYRVEVYDPKTIALLSYFFDEDSADCSSGYVGLFVSRDGGKSFRKTLVCAVQPTCTSFAIVTPERLIAGRTDGSTLVSKDGGRTWQGGQRLFDYHWQRGIDTGQVSPYQFWAQSMSFSDARHGFASTRGSGTWRTTNGGLSWTQEKSHECEYYLWGIGEIAAGSATTAITGGPHFISTRVETPADPGPCYPPTPQAAPEFVWHSADGAQALRPDGTYVLR